MKNVISINIQKRSYDNKVELLGLMPDPCYENEKGLDKPLPNFVYLRWITLGVYDNVQQAQTEKEKLFPNNSKGK